MSVSVERRQAARREEVKASADVRVPPWVLPVRAVRVLAAMLLSLGVATAVDLALRLWILPRYRNDEARRIRAINRIVRWWGVATFGVARIVLGLRVSFEGDAPSGGRYQVVANHQSSLDIPFLITVLRDLDLKFVAMEELRYHKPGVSLGLRVGGFVFVAKRTLGGDLVALRRFAKEVHRHHGSPVIFPEGKRCLDGSMLPFQLAGTETIRRAARLPVLPVVLDGPWRARTIRDLHRLVGARLRLRILPPIPVEAFDANPRSAYNDLEAKMRRTLDEIRTS